MASQTVKTRILIISDTHGASLDGTSLDGIPLPGTAFKRPLPSADLLIHCGDLTMDGAPSQYHATLDMLREIDAPVKLVIAGNHDLSLDEAYTTRRQRPDDHRTARHLWTADAGRARQAGIALLDEGTHTITLRNGADVRLYASPYTPAFEDWAFMHAHDEDRFNPAPAAGPPPSPAESRVAHHPLPSFTSADRPLDVVVTHGPPRGRLDQVRLSGDSVGCPHLLRAVEGARPLVHCFGHIHEGWGAERVRWREGGDGAASRPTTTATKDGKDGGWTRGLAEEDVEEVEWDIEETQEEHAVLVDVSAGSARPLARGAETLLVNAAIMNVKYKPVNAPWVVDLDLPASKARP